MNSDENSEILSEEMVSEEISEDTSEIESEEMQSEELSEIVTEDASSEGDSDNPDTVINQNEYESGTLQELNQNVIQQNDSLQLIICLLLFFTVMIVVKFLWKVGRTIF